MSHRRSWVLSGASLVLVLAVSSLPVVAAAADNSGASSAAPAPPTATPSFAPDAIAQGGTSTLSISVGNPDPSTDFTGVAFADALPAGLVVASAPASSTCSGGGVTAVPGTGTVSLTGATLAHGATCAVSVAVTAARTGDLTDSVSASSAQAGSGPYGSATLAVVASPDCVTTSTALCLVSEPAEGFTPIYRLLDSASSSIDMTMYELADLTAEDDLIAAHQRGVTVRIILDRSFSGQGVNQAAYTELQAAGVPVHWAPATIIYHQKTITVDGDVSAIGTANLTANYYTTSRDFWIVDRQPGDVTAVEHTFTYDWALSATTQTIQPGPAGQDLIWSPGSQTKLVAVIDGAQHTLQVENEEMNSTAIETALEHAAGRGVDVQVTMTASSSWTSAFDQLVSAGVHVHTYAGTAPLYIHAKVILADYGWTDQQLFVGSVNFSTSSMQYNRELGLTVADQPIADSIDTVLAADFADGTPWSTTTGVAANPGYWEVAADGGVFAFGDARFAGSMGGQALAKPIVGITSTPDGQGYWEVAADGGVFAFGDARFAGSMGGQALAKPIVGMTSTPDGQGYWEVAADGGVFAFGDARFSGSMGGQALAKPIVGITSTPDGQGYWEVAADGGVFAFGDARFSGSMGGQALAAPIVGITSTPDGQGYWEVAADGGVFAFGDARFSGSMGGQALAKPIVGITSTPDGQGYWEVAADGGVFAFGDARFSGSMGGQALAAPIVGITSDEW